MQPITTKVPMPTLAFVGGYLLPNGAFQIDMSAIQPGACRLVVVKSPHLPAAVAEIVEAAVRSGASPNPQLWARVFSYGMANVGAVLVPVLMELNVTGIAWSVGTVDAAKDGDSTAVSDA